VILESGEAYRPAPISVQQGLTYAVAVGCLGRRLSGILEKCLDVIAPEALDSADCVTGQLTATDHAVYCHRRQLQ
jgi:hypothetical protein